MKNKKNLFVIDAHTDIALNVLYVTNKDIGRRYKLHEGYNPYGFCVNNNIDIPRLKEGKVKFVFTSIFSLDKKSVKQLMEDTKSGYNFAKLKDLKTDLWGAIEQFGYYYSVIEKYKNIINLVKTKEDYFRIKKSKEKIGLILHAEGISYLKKPEDIDILFNLGLRSLALTWREKNRFGGGNNAQGGLTKLGKEVIELCNEKGIIIDLAHANQKTFFEALKIAKKPVIVSHTNVYSLQPHNRNLTDDQLKKIKENGGVVCLSVIYDQIGGTKLKDYIKHFLYVINLIGIDYVAFGTDFDGLIDPDIIFIKNFEDISKFPKVIEMLERVGLRESEIEKICYKNIERIIFSNLK